MSRSVSKEVVPVAKRLILCEKPSQARDFGAALGKESQTRTHIVLKNGDIVTNGFGHLVQLAPAAFFVGADPKEKPYAHWNWPHLPVLPPHIHKVINPPTDKGDPADQMAAIGRLLKEVDEVVIATDCDNEGELIAVEILEWHKWKGPTKRCLFTATDPISLRRAYADLKDASETRNRAEAAEARGIADWLIGMNVSPMASMALIPPGAKDPITGKRLTFSVGRVQTPTLALVVRRDEEIEKFRVNNYFEIVATTDTVDRSGNPVRLDLRFAPSIEKRITDKAEAERIAAAAKGQSGPMKVGTERKRMGPPKPFSLSNLTTKASAKWGWSADKVLEVAQKLYEEYKVTTYPRSDCEYFPETQIPDVGRILGQVGRVIPDLARFAQGEPIIRRGRSGVWSDEMVGKSSHHALMPNVNVNPADVYGRMDPDSKALYELICRTFIANLLPDYEYDQTTIALTAGGTQFKTVGSVPALPGWKAAFGAEDLEEEEDKKNPVVKLPPVADGANGTVAETRIDTKKTNPKPRYTEGTLVDAMKRADLHVDDQKLKEILKESKGIGTEATRGPMLANLKKKRLLMPANSKGVYDPKGKYVVSTPAARALVHAIDSVAPNLIDPATTARWEDAANKIKDGSLTREVFVQKTMEMLTNLNSKFREAKPLPIESLVAKLPAGKAPPIIASGRPPSQNALALAEKLAKQYPDVVAPKGWEKDSGLCSGYIDKIKRQNGLEDKPAGGGESRPPSDKQVALVKKIAAERKIDPPAGWEANGKICSEFLDGIFGKKDGPSGGGSDRPPSESQVKWVNKIRDERKIEPPKGWETSAKVASEFLDTVFGKKEKADAGPRP